MPLPKKCQVCPFSEWRDSEPQGYFCFHPAFTSNRYIGDGDQKPARIQEVVGARAPDWCPKENPLHKKPPAWVRGEDGEFRCSHCGERRVLMRLLGGTRDEAIDPCIAPIVKALNDGGILTAATCCGHGSEMGDIWLDDGRVLALFSDWDSYYAVYQLAVERGLVKPRQY